MEEGDELQASPAPTARPRPGARRTTAGGRATRLETEFRRRALVGLIQRGASFHEAVHYAMDQWDLKQSGATTLARKALNSLVESMGAYTGQSIAAVTLARAEFCFRKAVQQNSLNAMIHANAQIAAHWVKPAPEALPSEAAGGDDDSDAVF